MHALARCAALVLLILGGLAGAVRAQPVYEVPPATVAPAPFAQEELDALLAPVALYPDQLLAQVLMAATFPLDVVEADRYLRQHPGLQGAALDDQIAGRTWDPSVLSLAAFPQVLQMMSEQLDWTRRLGEAFLADQDRVMQTVQSLRARAWGERTLMDTPQQRIIVDDGMLVIEPARPEVIYIPTYDPAIVYGPWWAPEYMPFYWQPPSVYYPGIIGAGWVGFGVGHYVTHNHWGWASPDWRSRHIAIDLHRHNDFIDRRPRYREWVHEGWWQHRGAASRNGRGREVRRHEPRPGWVPNGEYRRAEPRASGITPNGESRRRAGRTGQPVPERDRRALAPSRGERRGDAAVPAPAGPRAFVPPDNRGAGPSRPEARQGSGWTRGPQERLPSPGQRTHPGPRTAPGTGLPAGAPVLRQALPPPRPVPQGRAAGTPPAPTGPRREGTVAPARAAKGTGAAPAEQRGSEGGRPRQER